MIGWTERGGKEGEGAEDRSKIAEERWRSRGHTAERNERKKPHFHGGFIGWRRSLPSYCVVKHMFRPVCSLLCADIHTDTPHYAVSDIGVTTAFYKVRDSSAKMCIRISLPRFYPPLPPLSSVPFLFIRFPSSYCLRARVPWCAIAMRFNFYSTPYMSHNFCEIQTRALLSDCISGEYFK